MTARAKGQQMQKTTPDRSGVVEESFFEGKPAYLTSFLLRPAMHHTQRCFLASGRSTYRKYALRAPQVENPTGRSTSPPSRRNPVRYAG